jgi:hypothetical protein
LVVIADHEQSIEIALRKKSDQLELSCVDILIFVNKQVTALCSVLGKKIGLVLEELTGEQYHVVMVYCGARTKQRFVFVADGTGEFVRRPALADPSAAQRRFGVTPLRPNKLRRVLAEKKLQVGIVHYPLTRKGQSR